MTDPHRAELIKDAWRNRPKAKLFEGGPRVRLTATPLVQISQIDLGPVIPTRSFNLIEFDFELKKDRGVDMYGRPQIRRQVVCEGVVVEEEFFPDRGSIEPPTLS